MRVALIPSWFPTPELPIFGSFVMDQARALCTSSDDLELHVLAPDTSPRSLSAGSPLKSVRTFLKCYRADVPTEVDPSCPNLFVHRLPIVEAGTYLGVDGWAPYRWIVQREMMRIERQYGTFDIVHAQVCYPAAHICLGLRPKRPWILTEHMGQFPFPELRYGPDGVWRRTQRAFKNAGAVVAVSGMHARRIEEQTAVRPTIIPNVCDETMFFPRQTRAPGPFHFLTVAGLVNGKGHDTLLTAIARFTARGHHARFTIVGAGPLASQLRDQCRTLGIDSVVEWSGAVSRAELPEVFRSADAFVLPSRFESFGVVFIEALATGIPVIATRCGGPEEFVDDENGVLVPVDDPEALADSMERMMGHSFDPARIREGFLGRFSRGVVADQIRHLYDDVLSRTAA